jgi:hypothetical protein
MGKNMAKKIILKEILRSICFLLIFVLLLSSLSKIFLPKSADSGGNYSRISDFYSQPEDTIDVLFLGASSTLRAVSPLIIWENYGIPSYVLASPVQPPVVIYNKFVEALKYQKPKIVFLDAVPLIDAYDVDKREPFLHSAVDPMRFSVQKINIALYVAQNSRTQSFSSYLFPILRYHSRWSELTESDFVLNQPNGNYYQRGSAVLEGHTLVELQEDFMLPNEDVFTLDPEAVNYYERIISISKENNIDVIIVSFPKSTWSYSRHLAVEELAQKNNAIYIDYNMPVMMEAVNFDPSKDFYDAGHVRISGAIPISLNIGEYLNSNFDLSDKRLDPSFSQWNEDALRFNESFIQ